MITDYFVVSDQDLSALFCSIEPEKAEKQLQQDTRIIAIEGRKRRLDLCGVLPRSNYTDHQIHEYLNEARERLVTFCQSNETQISATSNFGQKSVPSALQKMMIKQSDDNIPKISPLDMENSTDLARFMFVVPKGYSLATLDAIILVLAQHLPQDSQILNIKRKDKGGSESYLEQINGHEIETQDRGQSKKVRYKRAIITFAEHPIPIEIIVQEDKDYWNSKFSTHSSHQTYEVKRMIKLLQKFNFFPELFYGNSAQMLIESLINKIDEVNSILLKRMISE